MRGILTLFLIVVAHSAFAQDGPSFDCAKAGSEAERLVCGDADLARLDRLVAERFGAALDVIRGLDAGAAEAEANLRAFQRGWIKERDECWKAGDLRDCVESAYLRREGQLVAEWLLEQPTGISFWNCEGAVEVVTYFFDTTLPSVRFELGDTIDSGSLAPTASGSKYEGSFGRSIWIKGDEAVFRQADPDGSTHDCTLSRRE